ncbi:peroxiredoxin-2E-2, chloroplastic-like, partial [Macadamia integrifolia]|uniref:peroxiredoxin-2E-2, chloroplastic-like n=1 Tax=Macadamia integrifolia TaxID=60698 RepID=UPI001C4E9941
LLIFCNRKSRIVRAYLHVDGNNSSSPPPQSQLCQHLHSSLSSDQAIAVTASLTMARMISSPSPTSFSTTPRFTPKTLSSNFSFASPLRLSLRSSPLRCAPTSVHKTLISASISVGDKLPESTFSYFVSGEEELQTITVSELTVGKKVILFAVPGAFTPTCSQKHLPGFVEKSGELKSKGVDTIACISVNDAFVMKAWKEDLKIGDEVLLLSDGNGTFTKAIGTELDLSDKPVGLGVRSRRYAFLVDDGVVKVLNLEEGGAFTMSGAEDMLKAL